jgi:autophagy-related protein 9
LKDSHRKQLSNGLRDRFLFAGFMNVILAPVIVVYLMVVYFLRYFNVSYLLVILINPN